MIKFRSSLINQNVKSELELKIPSSSKDNTPSQGRITKSEMHVRGMEAIERIADCIESNGKSTVEALREHTLVVSKKLDFSQCKSNLMIEESKQKQERAAIAAAARITSSKTINFELPHVKSICSILESKPLRN
jgi:hypothetical protein